MKTFGSPEGKTNFEQQDISIFFFTVSHRNQWNFPHWIKNFKIFLCCLLWNLICFMSVRTSSYLTRPALRKMWKQMEIFGLPQSEKMFSFISSKIWGAGCFVFLFYDLFKPPDRLNWRFIAPLSALSCLSFSLSPFPLFTFGASCRPYASSHSAVRLIWL